MKYSEKNRFLSIFLKRNIQDDCFATRYLSRKTVRKVRLRLGVSTQLQEIQNKIIGLLVFSITKKNNGVDDTSSLFQRHCPFTKSCFLALVY